MSREQLEEIAEGVGMALYDSSVRPAQEGDLLIVRVVKSRTPIFIQNWVEGFCEEPPKLSPLLKVVGDYDVIRYDSETETPIVRAWGKAYIESVLGAELITYSTEESYVMSAYDSDEHPEKRLLSCLSEAIGVMTGHRPHDPPPWDRLKSLRNAAKKLCEITPGKTLLALTARYRDAPLLHRWPAPSWENSVARAFARCAIKGGKPSGAPYRGLSPNWEVPSFTVEV